LKEFILREGTDYGAQEAGMDNKVAQVHRQLARGDVLITFDPCDRKLYLADLDINFNATAPRGLSRIAKRVLSPGAPRLLMKITLRI
jgi:uncharacterized protein YheU (UPF0270 family)